MTSLTVLSLSLSLVAAVLSTYAVVAVRRSRAASLLRQLSEHSTTLEALTLQLRNMRARLNMRAYRTRKTGSSEEQDDPLAGEAQTGKSWKERANLALAMRSIPK